MNQNLIKIYGARQHNLQNINLEIPKNSLVVFTGLSGSGKSTLAFDTIYAEGQRRYIESLSSYARQFLDKFSKPDVDKIDGLTPSIAIDQKTTSKNPRSTVGTITEIYDYLRLLFARLGVQHCHKCGKEISSMSTSDIIEQVLKLPLGAKIIIASPIVKERKGTFYDLLEEARHKGFVRAKIDGVMARLDEDIELGKNKKHSISIVVDRLVIKQDNHERIAQSVEAALKESMGQVEIDILNASDLELDPHIHYSEHRACFDCKISFEELEPINFSFNSPTGACAACDGLGQKYSLDLAKVLNEDLSIKKGFVRIFMRNSYYDKMICAFAQANDIDINKPFNELSSDEQDLLLQGNNTNVEFFWKKYPINKIYLGAKHYIFELLKKDKDFEKYVSEAKCDVCGGNRLKKESLNVIVAKKNIAQMIDMPIEDLYDFFNDDKNFSKFSKKEELILKPILKEIKERLFFLVDVGLGYLSLNRDARTISGGESQRIRIASQIGSGLTGVSYVFDEPSIGLHERDTQKLIRTLKNLRDRGNSVLVVEHDRQTIEDSDYVIDIGPLAGKRGGNIVFDGHPSELKNAKTLTAQYMYGKKDISHNKHRAQKKWLTIDGVNINNIKGLKAKIPLENLVCITGVSGSGKSSLVISTLLPVAKTVLNHATKIKVTKGIKVDGFEHLDKVIYLDQKPIGRTPKSVPATYIGMMDDIRELFSQIKASKIRGYTPRRFSFNVKGGRCEKCSGDGEVKIEMHFLPDITITCDACGGKRYNAQTLEILLNGKTIGDVLEMSVDEATTFFRNYPKIYDKLKTLQAVGLGYIKIGQNATTLSGGEAQRIKLAKELVRKNTGSTLYILDEPTTGLHFADIDKLLEVLSHLVDLGNSVIVIEHNMDVIKNADYIIDMGPEGGIRGGKIIAKAKFKDFIDPKKKMLGYTAKFLKEYIK